MGTSKTVIVAGDVMIDWHLSSDRDEIVALRSWGDTPNIRRAPKYGGAWLLEDLIRHFAGDSEYDIRGPERPDPAAPDVHQTYTVIRPDEDDILRASEFLGVERPAANAASPSEIRFDDADAAVVALLDSDFGFDEQSPSWPAAITQDGADPWIVLKTSVPDFKQDFWRRLIAKHADRLIVVFTIEDLRHKEVQLIRHLSWERTAQDLISELHECPTLKALLRCKYLVVSFGAEGAILIPRKGEGDPQLVFDPALMENEWTPDKKLKLKMIGYTTILAAAVAHELMIHPQWPQLADALPRAIAGMRALYENGYGTDKKDPAVNLQSIADAALKRKKKIVSTVTVGKPDDETWSVLGARLDRQRKNFPEANVEDAIYELAARVAVFGPEEALTDAPQLSIGNLFTVDRKEIESYRSIKVLLTEYVKRLPATPLSIAVFGTPGSGKSFGVKEIAKAIEGKKKIEPLTFNLTQFADADDLRGAFHRVRDVSLSGKVPLVFWDEFDTTYGDKALGWLRYFISPMQDASFQEQQVTHPIGTSIFVFAGGTANSKDEFTKPPAPDDRKAVEEWKALKVPDFISRIKGFLDITGPNRRDPHGDPHYLIRRAILLRSMLWKDCDYLFRTDGKRKILQISPGVLHAFLHTENYRHGARSLESIINMSTLAGRTRFVSSSLPPEPQLELHVVLPFESPHEYKFSHDVEVLEKQAKIAHNVFREIKNKQGWEYAEIRDDQARRHNLLVEYAQLPEHEKEANRGTVRMIPAKVASAGYAAAPAGRAEPRTMNDTEIERLAKLEHDIWRKRKEDAGYKPGPVATESPKQSPYLVEWDVLDGQWKDVDRGMVRAIPRILAEADHILVDVNDLAPPGST